MKKNHIRIIVLLMLSIAVSCDEPDTVVTNIVHPDGSVTRKIVMRNTKNIFNKAELQLPFDSTWIVIDSVQVSSKGDTTWVKSAEKLFKSVEEINSEYKNDSSVNGKLTRFAGFNKKFRWFNTQYRYSESINKLIPSGYSVRNFLSDEDIDYYYSPDYIKFNMENGVDSIKFKVLADSIDKKSEKWIIKNIASLWIDEFSRLTESTAGTELSKESLKSREDELAAIIDSDKDIFDSLWTSNILFRKFVGEEDAIKFKTEADSAMSVAFEKFLVDIRNYSVRIVMPGRLIATNGYIDSTRNLLWPVKSDSFLTDNYEMWAESKTPNIWAWIVSGLFLVFVASGIILKKM